MCGGHIVCTVFFVNSSKRQYDTPFRALERAIKEVWGVDLCAEWLCNDDDVAIGSIYHEISAAPAEPFSDAKTYETWDRVSALASKYAGRDMYIESINAGKSQYFWV